MKKYIYIYKISYIRKKIGETHKKQVCKNQLDLKTYVDRGKNS